MRKMQDIMSPAPVCMAPGDSVYAAAQAMQRHGTGTVLVLTDGRLSGLVTDRDITVRVLAEGRDPRATRIGDICGRDLLVLGPDDDGIPVGVVSVGDLAQEKDATSVLSGISSAAPNS